MRATICLFCAACFIAMATPAKAEPPWVNDNDTRYMALGDSLSAGQGAQPATQGFVYLLYQRGVFDKTPNTLFANSGVPGATSEDVLLHQVPQAVNRFEPNVVTITVGANDLLSILSGADPVIVLGLFQANLFTILNDLRSGLPEDAVIIIGNLYTIAEIPNANEIVPIFNGIVDAVAAPFNVQVADVFNAFGGFEGRSGLLLIDRNGAGQFEVHPTNAGYRVMANAFEQAFLATPE